MPSAPPASVATLRTSSEKLNQITDSANEIIREVEEFLEGCSFKSSVRVCIGQNSEVLTGYLEYQKLGQHYRVVVNWFNSQNEPKRLQPLSDCPRESKLRAIAILPKFLDAIRADLEAQLKIAFDAEAAISTVRAMLPEMKEGA